MANDHDIVQKRVDDHICAACRRPIIRGHRIQRTFICLDPHAVNPEALTQRSLELGVDFEFVHTRCDDPFLNGKRII